MSNIIVFCGKKSAGKNCCSNFLHGYQLKSYNIIEDFGIREDTGGLIIKAKSLNENADEETTEGEIDITRDDLEFGEWAAYNMWPFIKNYSFATELKAIAMGLFNIPRECVYGTDQQKNQKQEHLLWENMPGLKDKKKTGPMTAREFMQFFGSEVMRKMYDNIWIDRTLKNIKTEDPQIAIISDCRFDNEAIALKKAGAKLVYLTRSVYADDHISENGFQTFTEFDTIIDNKDMTIQETHQELIKAIDSWGWIGQDTPKKEKGIKKIKKDKQPS